MSLQPWQFTDLGAAMQYAAEWQAVKLQQSIVKVDDVYEVMRTDFVTPDLDCLVVAQLKMCLVADYITDYPNYETLTTLDEEPAPLTLRDRCINFLCKLFATFR